MIFVMHTPVITVIVIFILKFPGTFPKNALINCLQANHHYKWAK